MVKAADPPRFSGFVFYLLRTNFHTANPTMTTNNIPDSIKRLEFLEDKILNLIPFCDDNQITRCEDAINILLKEKNRLLNVKDNLLDNILIQINKL